MQLKWKLKFKRSLQEERPQDTKTSCEKIQGKTNCRAKDTLKPLPFDAGTRAYI